MTTIECDVAVLGGGPGGYVAAIRAAQLGAKVALIEKGKIGGVCLNIGCIPTKALLATAEALSNPNHGADLGVSGNLALDYPAAQRHKDRAVEAVVSGVKQLLSMSGVKPLKGPGRLVDVRTIEVETASGLAVVKARKGIILAPGSVNAQPPFPVANHPAIVDSTGALALPEVPKHLLIIGGGVIGVEFASIFRSFGSQVVLGELLPNLLPGMDVDLSRRLEMAYSKQGIEVYTDCRVEEIFGDPRPMVKGSRAGEECVLAADAVLVATGRRPATEGLGLEEVGVDLDGRVIKVNSHLETSVRGIFAVGDATGAPMLAHRAMAQGRIAAENLLGASRDFDETSVPYCVYSEPEVAAVGLTLDAATNAGISGEESSFPFASNGRALTVGRAFGEVKLVCETGTRRLLGAHMIGPGSTELISEAALAIRLGLSADAIADTVHPHPGFGEALMEAALGCRGSMIHHIVK
jgi:dihydrolipoamide dehydrogenase